MKKITPIWLVICLSFPLLAATDVSKQGLELLEKADRRFYVEAGTYDITLTFEDESGGQLVHETEIYKNGREKQTCVWLSPTVMRNNVGMRNGNKMYYKPAKLHKPQVASYRALFVDSDFSWGDIMSSDIAYDYEATSIEETEYEGHSAYLIVLNPKSRELYARIDVFIEKETSNTLKRIYYTASGDVLKTASYYDVQVDNRGNVTGFTVEMVDDFFETRSVAVIENIKKQSLPSFLFDYNNIGRIHASR